MTPFNDSRTFATITWSIKRILAFKAWWNNKIAEKFYVIEWMMGVGRPVGAL